MDHKNLIVITTHINADFDALASMLAAQKLYPEALVVFPGSQEKNLRNFFIKSMVYLFNMANIKEIDFSAIKKLILVDTRQPGRIGKFSSILDRKGLDIHIYDHHPAMPNDIKGNFETLRQTGSTVAILTEIIKKKKIHITPDEATIMCLGIYEDTGSFTYKSTSEEDFKAASFLLSKGANLNIISTLISREISSKQVEILNDMIQAAHHYNINGIEIVITSITSDNYVADFAFLVQKMVKMENINAIFGLALMENKIYLVARSRITDVDVGEIVTTLGGGGHIYAAAATIKNETLAQTEHRLIEVLYDRIKSRRHAEDLMSSPPITVDINLSCRDAGKLLTRYNINALLATVKKNDKEELKGYISRQVIEKAIFHKLDSVPIQEYMTTDLATVNPEADFSEIQDKIIENKQRILPVVKEKTILGVVTRTDLLNILAIDSKEKDSKPNISSSKGIHARTRNINNFLRERLTKRIIKILRSIGTAAKELGFSAYVIGGFVRDLFLYRPNEDIDIVIEGEGIAFAKRYAKITDARTHIHRKFGTAVIIFPDGFKIDVATARMEYYKFPAALPKIEMSSIKLDLFRRDFTINTLAIQLNPNRFGTLIDFFSAQKDIKENAIRVLHNLSFVEDPTRVFRAIRFEQRFGFTIGKLTSSLIENAVRMDFIKRLSGRRLFTELRQILGEENPSLSIKRLNDYNLLQIIHPSIKLTDELIDLFNSVKKVLSWHDLLFLEETYLKWAVYFLALTAFCDKKSLIDIFNKFELPMHFRTIFGKDKIKADRCLFWFERKNNPANSIIYRKLNGFRTESILYMIAKTKKITVKRIISYYYTQLKNIKTKITGKDLKKMGVKPGPIYRDVFQAILEAKLNNDVTTQDEEFAFAMEFIDRYTKKK